MKSSKSISTAATPTWKWPSSIWGRLEGFQSFSSVQFSSVAQSCPTLCDPMDCSTPGLPVHHQLPEFTQTHIHRVGDAIHPSHPLLSPSPPALNLSQHQGLFQWVSSLHQVAKLVELQLQHQPFQWIFKTDFLQDGLVGLPSYLANFNTLWESQAASPPLLVSFSYYPTSSFRLFISQYLEIFLITNTGK